MELLIPRAFPQLVAGDTHLPENPPNPPPHNWTISLGSSGLGHGFTLGTASQKDQFSGSYPGLRSLLRS